MSTIPNLSISFSDYTLENGETGRVAVFIYNGNSNPKEVLDRAVREYVQNNGYHELIDANMDNPWMRVILSDINNIHQVPFDSSIHKLTPRN